ncbi:uncharacterized protein THITE_2123637 [Thermothielavioides terrestris NRRL 8126]|uniref:RING-type domain-containing protein n=2 Tax=Thermothielavioides terrestris TaxID=2587410 RepID=G2RHQ7_THETT|nr:uncharacterized protein THITE_2123637 [Thermothielavioides terrestris NRRL 8126]AEO71369.1 hypothetical protein THITE_2123637 [Thermothielavioides terrestris NRRL 8126]
MGELRRKIQAIQLMDVPQTSKARMMHQLLTEKYTRSQQSPRRAQAAVRPVSPASSSTLDAPEPSEPFGPLQAFRKWNPLGDGSGPVNLPLTEEDLRPTYAPNRRPSDDTEWYLEEDPEEERERRLGCEHYRRNVKMQCASCERWYTCRLCHDAVEDHVLPRQQTKHMLCMLCGCAQKVADTCTKCGRSAAYYYCGICKLWNDDPNKPIYHCPDCDLCRVGQGLGKDFFHCKKCMACIAISGTGKHKCIERSTDCDCPICNEYMFNSPKPVIFMQCGHSIHRHCFEEHMKTSYKCPLCNKSCINMEYQFRNFDIAILNQPMPPEYADARAVISCNDCSAKSQTAFHWLGLKCAVCRSYNTVQLQLLNMPGDQSSQPQSQPQPQPQPLQQHPEQQQQQLQQQQQPTALNPDLPPDQPDQQQPPRRTHRGPELDREDITDPAPAPALPSTSPSSSYSPAFLFRLLYRTAAPSSAAPAPSPRTRGGEGDGGDWAAAAPISPRGGVRGGGRGRGSGSGGSVCSDEEEAEAHWEEEEDGDEDMLDLFGGRDRTFEWMTGFMSSTESAVGGDDDEDEEEEEEDDEAEGSEGEEGDDEDEDEEDDILLLGHR